MKLRVLLLVALGLSVPWVTYRLGSKRAEAKCVAAETSRRDKYKAEAKEREAALKKLLRAAEKAVRKDAEAKEREAGRLAETKAQPTPAQVATDRLNKYEALVGRVPKMPNTSIDPYPTWLIKVPMTGVKGDPLKRYHAVFKLSENHKATVAARFGAGQRLHLEMEPFDQQPEAVRRLPMVDELNDFESEVYWVKSFEHDEPGLKGEGTPYGALFAQLFPEILMRSPQDVAVAGGSYPFYFYGSNWGLYREWASEKLQANTPGTPRHAVTTLSQALKKRGIRLIFVPVPMTASVFTDLMLGRDDGLVMEGPPANKSVSDLLETLRKDGVEVVDATRVLRADRYVEFEGSRYPVNQPNDTHLSSVGLMKLAKVIAQTIDPALEESTGGRLFKITREVVPHPPSMLNFPAIKAIQHPMPTIPMLMEKVVGVDDAASEMLKETAPASAVQLVGDSHIGVYLGARAGVHSHLVRELAQRVNHVAIAGNAYNAAMDAWLRSEGFAHAKTVVWMVAEAYLDFPGWIDASGHPRFATSGEDVPNVR